MHSFFYQENLQMVKKGKNKKKYYIERD